MSLKPPKRSDMDKEWMSKRRDRRQSIQPEYHLIISEGEKTEPNYFNEIKTKINDKYRDKIQLEIFGEGANTVSLFEKAKKRAEINPNGYKHIWIIYDTDDFMYDKIDKVAELCEQHSTSDCQYHAIWSNQCIELWFLLHFSYMQSDLHRKEYWPKLTENLAKINKGKYEKNRSDMFVVLRPYMEEAISNAKKLHRYNKGKAPSRSTPGTMVYSLIEKLKPYL